jgi:hypothetical protein
MLSETSAREAQRLAHSPPPFHRGLAALLAAYGAVLANTVSLLGAGFLVVLGILWVQGSLRAFAKFALTVLLPVGVGLVIIWGFIRQGAPGSTGEASVAVGVLFATTTTMRLALLAGVFLAAMFALPPERMVHLLKTFGIHGRTLAIVVSTLNLWPDFKRHVEQVFAGRCARGLMPDRRFSTRMRQLPYAIRTLFISALGQGLDRADSWESSGLIERLENFSHSGLTSEGYSKLVGVFWLALAIAWAVTSTLFFVGT